MYYNTVRSNFFFQSSIKGTLTRARTELNPEYLDLRPRAELNPEYWNPCTPLVSTDGPFSNKLSILISLNKNCFIS